MGDIGGSSSCFDECYTSGDMPTWIARNLECAELFLGPWGNSKKREGKGNVDSFSRSRYTLAIAVKG